MPVYRVLCAYGVGLAISVLIGVGVWALLKARLSDALRDLFPHEEVRKFWEQLVGISIMLATVSAGIGFYYSEKAQTDRLVLLWNFMDHIQDPLEAILKVFLCAFVPLLLAYVYVIRRK
jgi:hypothetical protein